jgi:hypothetical protein
MEDHNSILYTYYSKYKSGNPRFTRALTKLAPFAKDVLKDVITELPTKLKEKIRDDIATEILSGNNPLNTLSKSIVNRAFESALKSGEYSEEDVYKAFKPLEKREPLYAKTTNLNPFSQNKLSFDFPKYKNPVYYTDSSDENKEPMLRGGQSNIYQNKILKYYNKLMIIYKSYQSS